MKRVRSTEEMYQALHLRQTEIERLFDLSYNEAKAVYEKAREKDCEELSDKVLFADKVRMESVRWAMGISKAQFENWALRKLKSGL